MAENKKPMSFDEWANAGGGAVKPVETGLAGRAGDLGLSLLKGAIAVPEAAVGAADIVTGGKAGKKAEELGFRPKEAKAYLDSLKSDAAKDAQYKFENADGFTGKLGAAVQNPSLIANAIAESVPLMGAGGVVGRGLVAAAPRLGAAGAAAAGEGVVGAGSAAEGIRQETTDGELTGKQSLLAAGSGAATGLLGLGGAKAAKALGVGDIDQAIVGGTTKVAGQAGKEAPGMLSSMGRGALSEGVFEELPQSLSEQAIQNVALDKPWTQDLDAAAAMGLLTGGAMGGGMGLIGRQDTPAAAPPDPAPAPVPPAGPAPMGQNLTDTPMSSLMADGELTGATNPLNSTGNLIYPTAKGYPGMNTPKPDSTVDPETKAIIPAEPGIKKWVDPNQPPAPLGGSLTGASMPSMMGGNNGLTGAPLEPIKPSEQMGLNPAAGPLSAAAVTAVDGDATPSMQAAAQAAAQQDQATQAQQQSDSKLKSSGWTMNEFPVGDEPMVASLDSKDAPLFMTQATAEDGTPTFNVRDTDWNVIASGSTFEEAAGRAKVQQASGGKAQVTPQTTGATDGATPAQTQQISQKGQAEQDGDWSMGAKPIATPHGSGFQDSTAKRAQGLKAIRERNGLNKPVSLTDEGKTGQQQEPANATTAAPPVQPGGQAADAGTAPVAQGAADTGGGLAGAGETAATGQPEQAKPLTASESAAPAGRDDRTAKALDRVARGTAYFAKEGKANEWIKANGLTNTHTVEQDASGANKWNIVAKNEPESAQATAPVSAPDVEALKKEVDSARAAWQQSHAEPVGVRLRAALKALKDATGSEETTPAATVSRPSADARKRNLATLKARMMAGRKPGTVTDEGTKQAEPSLDDMLKAVNDELANQGMVQNARTRERRDQIRKAIAERDFPDVLKAVDGDVGVAEAINQAFQFAGDEPRAKVVERVLKNRGITDEYRKRWGERLVPTEATNEPAADAGNPASRTVTIPPSVDALLTQAMEAQKGRITRLRNQAKADGSTLEERKAANLKVIAAEATLRKMRTTRFDAEDAVAAAMKSGNAEDARSIDDLFPKAFAEVQALLGAKADAPTQEMINEAIRLDVRNPGVMTKAALQEAIDQAKQRQKAEFDRIKSEIESKKSDAAGTTSNISPADDLDAMFDDVLAEEVAKDEAASQPDPKPTNLKQAITQQRAKRAPRTATQAATSAAKNTASALGNAIDGLGALFGGGGKLNSGLSFDSETYAKAKPLFQAAVANLGEAGRDMKEAMRAVVRMVMDKFGAQVAQNMKPYVVKFIEETSLSAPADKNVGDAKTLTESLYQAIKANQMPKDNPALKKLVEAFDGKPADQARMKQAQEELETAIVMMARELVSKNEGDRTTFDTLLRLYQSQPNLNIRTSTSIANQAYSTPAPLAYLASRLAGITKATVAHEPTAGTGMLLIGADPKKAIVNELNDLRIEALKSQGFEPTQKDAATQQLVPSGKQPDAVVTNPPFGSIKDADGNPVKVKVDGYSLGQIDHLIAARALDDMKDDGRATLIIGANKVAGGLNTDDRIFFNWLYSHYNVTGHFEIEGDLYNRQGAGWPVRVITVNGRAKSNKISPVAGTIQRVNNWDAVYEQFTQILAAPKDQGSVSAATTADAAGARPSGPVAAPGQADKGGPTGSPRSTGDVTGAGTGAIPDRTEPATGTVGDGADEQRINAQSFVPATQPGQNPDGAERLAKPAGTDPVAEAQGNEFQAPYTPRSARKDEGVLIPANMAQPTQDALSRLEDEVGDIDEFARKELGYDTVADLHGALMGLQVDSVATAIYQIKQGKAVVIADQTGIGKGRQAASIIRWAAKQGMTPVFVSVKPSLFTDMYGDLADIGTNDVTPFIMNSDAWVAGDGGSKLFANKPTGHKNVIQEIANTGRLPDGSNALFMTYSQINVANVQRQALMALAPNAVFVLDESHNAAGASATGDFVIGALDAAKGVVYLSATYAKRPDNMPLYFKTDIGDAASDTDGLAVAMASGGLPLQTVVSNNLVKAGQMFRRERSYDGVSIASVFDTANRALHERMSDEATKALRAIVSADRMFHEIYVKSLAKRLALEGATVQDKAGNQVERGVQHTEFSSVVHNFVKQMLLGLKAQSAADEAIASLKRGEKPIIAVENTMGSFLTEYAAANGIGQGESLGAFDYRTVLSRALARSRVIVEVLPNGDKVKRPVSMAELDEVTQASYRAAQAVIDGLTLSIPVSPIDWIRAEIARAGYKVAEITGRSLSVDYGNPKKPILSAIDAAEQKDKVNTTRQFNSGNLDALILNVAGSTGISLHASEKFEDQRQRHMIVAQAAGDINIFMQMLGRVHRTGQVRLPKYTILSVDLPTEKRPTAVLSIKMKSLNANTSSNTESATSVKSSDILNKYGDQIVNQYLSDNYALARALGIEQEIGTDPTEDIARKATGRLALQPIEVQTGFYEEVESQYEALIDYLNKTNQNDLEPRTFDFDAKEKRQEVLFDGPNKGTPFGEDAIYGEYSIKAQGEPMKPAEIKAVIAENLAGKTGPAHASALVNTLLQTYADQMNADRAKIGLSPGKFDEAKYTAFMKGLYGEDGAAWWVSNAKAAIAKGQDVARMTPEQMANVQGSAAGIEFIRDHPIGKTFRVDINSEPFNAVVTGIRSTHKSTGNPFSLSKIQVTVAVNGALRSLSIPATQFRKIEVSSIATGFQIEQLFKEQPPNQRETAKIITGNLLAAYGELQGVRGTIITFTKQDGTSEQGILLPKLFDYTKNTRGDYRLQDGAAALKFLQQSENKDIGRFGIMTRDGEVRVLPAARGIRVQVPKSKLKGAKYFLDKGLIGVGGDFVTQGAFMVSVVYEPSDAVKMLDLLMKKQALYALPSMAEEAKALTGGQPDSETPAASRARPVFSRAAQGQASGVVQSIVDAITARWANAPKVVVAFDMSDPAIPERVRQEDQRQRSGGAEGTPEGFYYKGTVYLMSSKLANPRDVVRVLFHEALGHYGLRGVFGKELKPLLQQIATMRKSQIEAKMKEYGLRGVSNVDRLIAAEEVLAELAQSNPQIGFVRRAVATIKAWLRKHIPGFMGMNMSDDEIITSFILPARNYVVNGGPDGGTGGGVRFNRSVGDASPDEAQKVQAAIEGKSLIDAAKFVVDTGEARHRVVAEMVTEKLKALQSAGVSLDLKIAHRGFPVPTALFNSRGYTESAFDDKGRDITVWLNGADVTGKVGTDYETLLHELVHAATMGGVLHGSTVRGSPFAKDAADLMEVTDAIASHINKRFDDADAGRVSLTEFELDMRAGANNAFTKDDETLAWALSSVEAQQYLETIPYKKSGQTMWGRFVQAVRSAIGLEAKADTALSEVLRLGASIMSTDGDANVRGVRAFWHKRGLKMATQQANGSVVLRNEVGPAYPDSPTHQKKMDQAETPTNPDIRFSRTGNGGTLLAMPEMKYPKAGSIVDGRVVRDNVPNMGSISAELDEYTVLPGVREVPISEFTLTGRSYSVSETKRIEDLAERITDSGEINPLIVVIDAEGPYILEGGHRAEALFRLGAKSFPAVVVTDDSDEAMFSRSIGGALADGVNNVKAFDVTGATGDRLAHYRGMGMQVLGRRQIVDLYGDMLPELKAYDSLVQKMDADKNESGAEADALVSDWAKLDEHSALGFGAAKNPGMERKLAELMHDATLAQIDPDKPIQNGDDAAQHASLSGRFNALSPKAQEVYRTARDMYADHFKKVQQAIQDRIQRSSMDETSKAKMIARMDADLFNKLKGVYFPLARFGKYVVVSKNADGETVSVSRAETLAEANNMRREVVKNSAPGVTVSRVYKDAEFNASRDAVGKGFVSDLMTMLQGQGVGEDVLDSVGQLYLASMPDLSWAKHGIHRKGTPGFSQDARRAFAQNMFHGARHLAKLRYSDQLADKLMDMEERVKDQRDDEGFDQIKAQQVVDEMNARHETLMNPKTSSLSTALTSLGFVWFLGISPASAMVNLSQTALVAYPVMAAKWGFQKAGTALLSASAEVARAGNDLGKVLKGEELAAFQKAVDDGTIDVTQAHDLAGVAQGEDERVAMAMRPVMRAASFMFHHAEKFNRQATFIAAYRLAKENGADADKAFEQAKKATYDGHFDYSASNRPRLMQGNWQKVLFLFKQYGQNMVYTLTRQAYLSMKGMTPEQRTEARKQLGGLLAMHAMAAGALGLPLVGVLLSAASMAGGDDDEPWDAEVALKNMMADAMGPKAAEVMAHGLSRLTPWDLSGRVALNKLILPDLQEGLEGQPLWEKMVTAAAGPVAGIGGGFVKGMAEMGQGQYQRGLESMLPVALKNTVKAMRFGEEGAVDKTGVVIKDEVGAAGVIGQALGFRPSDVALATEGKTAIYQADKALTERRSNLVRLYAMARMNDDSEGTQDALDQVRQFNEKNPNRRITMPNLMQSVRNRQRRIDDAEQGVYLPKNRRDALEAGRFAMAD